jgi:hypothetical protein
MPYVRATNEPDQFSDGSKSNLSCVGSRYGDPSGQTGSGGSGFFLLATSPPISEALAACALDRTAGTLGIVNPELDTVRIAEIELGEIAVQMLFAAVLIDADHATFED